MAPPQIWQMQTETSIQQSQLDNWEDTSSIYQRFDYLSCISYHLHLARKIKSFEQWGSNKEFIVLKAQVGMLGIFEHVTTFGMKWPMYILRPQTGWGLVGLLGSWNTGKVMISNGSSAEVSKIWTSGTLNFHGIKDGEKRHNSSPILLKVRKRTHSEKIWNTIGSKSTQIF